MKLVKLSATALGAIVSVFSLNSCAKKQECCSLKYSYGGATYDVKACEDGNHTTSYTYSDGTIQTYSGNFNDEYTWEEIKTSLTSYSTIYSGSTSCDDEKI